MACIWGIVRDKTVKLGRAQKMGLPKALSKDLSASLSHDPVTQSLHHSVIRGKQMNTSWSMKCKKWNKPWNFQLVITFFQFKAVSYKKIQHSLNYNAIQIKILTELTSNL